MTKYKQLAIKIVDSVGGIENIANLSHCMTRLRFILKNDAIVKEDVLKEESLILKSQKTAGMYQIVIGTQVKEVYQVICSEFNLNNENKKTNKKTNEKHQTLINKMIEVITKVITPVLGVLVACGLLMGLLAICTATGILNTNSGTYIILNTMAQAAFYFLPILLGYTSAKAFGLNPFIGMILGGVLISPNLLSSLTTGNPLYIIFKNTIFESPVYNTFFKIPILFPTSGYQATVIPIIFITYFASKIDRILNKIIPKIIIHNLNSFFILLISVPVSILVIGPITNFLSLLLSAGIHSLYILSPIVTAIIVALLYQPLVIFGLHWPLSAIGLNNLISTGSDYILPMSFVANFAQTAVVFAVFLKTKDKKLKALSVPTMFSGIFCIIEPAIYGFTLPVKKRFIYSMIASAVGAVIISLFSAKMYAFSFGLLGFAAFINPKTGSFQGLLVSIFATVITMLIAFSLTYFTFTKKDDIKNKGEKND
ncbi:MAG: PTS transporter subunit EIIC [Fusobacteriaceae bacterium]